MKILIGLIIVIAVAVGGYNYKKNRAGTNQTTNSRNPISKKMVIISCMMITLLLPACNTAKKTTSSTDNNIQKAVGPELSFKVKELLVGFDNKESYQKSVASLEKNEGVKFQKLLMNSGDAIIGLFTVPEGEERKFIEIFEEHNNVKYAELNGIIQINSSNSIAQ